MNLTMMTGSDLRQLCSGYSVFYSTLFAVSPKAAGALQNFVDKVEDIRTITTDRGGDADEDDIDIPEGTVHEARLRDADRIPEEHLRIKGIDLVLNESLETLKGEIANGTIKPGTVAHTVTQHTIDTIESFRRREVVTGESNLENGDFPGWRATQKVANYSFIPKLEGFAKVEKVDEKGKKVVEYQYPEGFAKDDEERNFFFQPRRELREGRGIYEAQQIDQAGDRINFDGLTSAATGYLDSLRQINNMIGTQPPETPEQDKILRDRARVAAERMRMEVKAAQATDKKDPVALRFFGDKEGQMADVLSDDPSQGRALVSDLKSIDNFISFLDSGLPITAYSEYQEMIRTTKNLQNESYGLRDYFEGMGELEEESKKLHEKLTNIPPKMSPEQSRDWFNGIREGFERCTGHYQEISKKPIKEDAVWQHVNNFHSEGATRKLFLYRMADKEKITGPDNRTAYVDKHLENFNDQDPEYQEYRKKSIEKDFQTRKESLLNEVKTGLLHVNAQRVADTILPSMDRLGERRIAERKEYITEMLGSMSNDMSSISKDLKEVAKEAGDLPKALNVAVKQAVRAGDPKLNTNPKEYLQALDAVKAEAEKAGNQQILDFAKKNRAYFSNRTLEAQSKGILMDESLKHQRDAIERNGKDNLKQAIDAFNTRRSGIFGGRGTEFGAESPEHKALREAATELGNLKNQLEQAGPDKQKELSEKLKSQAEKVSGLANDYLDKKGRSANTSAGKARLNGAMEILREAEITRIELKRKEAAAARYEEIGAKTANMVEANRERGKQLKERAQRIEQEMQQEKKQRHEQFMGDRKNIKAGMDAAKEAAQALRSNESPERRRSTSMDKLAEKFGMKEDMKKTGKKEKSHAAQKQAEKGKEQEEPEMGGEN